MAKKGQKFNKYNQELVSAILTELQTGKSSLQISRETNIPSKTIRTWKRKLLIHPELYPGLGRKRGRIKEVTLTKEDWKERYEIVKKYQAFLKAQREKR